MFGLTSTLKVAAGSAVIIGLVAAWGFRVDSLRADWRDEALGWRKSTTEVTAQIGNAIGNKKLKWENVGKQVEIYADGYQQLQDINDQRNATIDQMGAERERLMQLNGDLRVKAEKLIKQRAKLIDRLAERAMTPGDRENCQAQIAVAEAALDEVWESGE